jgi:hypothetical protein
MFFNQRGRWGYGPIIQGSESGLTRGAFCGCRRASDSEEEDREPRLSGHASLKDADRACLERARSRQPANGRLAHAIGPRKIGLHSAFRESLNGLPALMRG